MSELFIHIGSHKTGTTSIQQACSHLLSGKESKNIKYLNIRPSGTRIVEDSGALENFTAQIRIDAADEIFRPFIEDIYIVSDESFFWISEPATVHQFAKLLKDRFSRITIICYLRRQDLLALSHRTQVANGMPAARFYGVQVTPLPQYQPHFQSYFNYADKLSAIWATAFGKENIQVISYDVIAKNGGDVGSDFANRLGIKFDAYNPIRANVSIKGNRALVGLKLMAMGVSRARAAKILENLPSAGEFLPTRNQAKAFLSHFEGSNRQLALDWKTDGVPVAFDDDFAMYPDVDKACWSNADVEKIVQAVVKGMRHTDPK
jgi:hypothetical protein